MYKVFRTEPFELQASKTLSQDDMRALKNIERQLTTNPHVGRYLRVPFFREKRLGSKRVYYLIYDDIGSVLLVAASTKKQQQDVIDTILSSLQRFRELAASMQRAESGLL